MAGGSAASGATASSDASYRAGELAVGAQVSGGGHVISALRELGPGGDLAGLPGRWCAWYSRSSLAPIAAIALLLALGVTYPCRARCRSAAGAATRRGRIHGARGSTA